MVRSLGLLITLPTNLDQRALKAATWLTQRPRSDCKPGKNKVNRNVPRRTMSKHTRGSGAGHVKENAGIGPFFEPGETRRQYGNGSQHLPESDYRREICRISKMNESLDISRHLCELGHAA